MYPSVFLKSLRFVYVLLQKGFPNASHSLAKMEEHVWRMNLTKTDFTATALPNIKGNIAKVDS